MLLHSAIKKFAEKIASFSEYKIIDEKKESGVVLLVKENKKDKIIQF